MIEVIQSVLELFPAVAGAGAAIAVLVQIFKWILGPKADGFAGLIALAINALLWILIRVSGALDLAVDFDSVYGFIEAAGALLLPLLASGSAAKLIYMLAKWTGIPLSFENSPKL